MDVSKLPQMKWAVIFDATAINSESSTLRFLNYLTAFKTFIRGGQVLKSYLIMHGDPPPRGLTLKFEITQNSAPNVVKQILKKWNIELLVAFGHLEVFSKCISNFNVKNAVFISDDPIPIINLHSNLSNRRVLPGRILFTLYDAKWWNVTPFESIDERDIQTAFLPDNTLNELNCFAIAANQCYD